MKRHWKIIVALIVAVPLFLSIWGTVVHIGAEQEVNAYKKSLIASGEKLDISKVVPSSLPPEQNGADVLNEAFGLFTSEAKEYTNVTAGMRMIAPGRAMAMFAQPADYESSWTNSWSNLAAVMEDNRPATELLEQAAGFPGFDFHVDYHLGIETPLTYLAPLKRGSQLLSTAAICHLHNGDAASATTNICAILGLVNGEQNDRLLICQLVRIAMASIAANTTWELLQSTNITDAQLAALQKSWERLEYVHAFEHSLLMERAVDEMTIQKMRDSPEYMEHILSSYDPSGSGGVSGSRSPLDLWDNVKFGYAKAMWRASWTYSDELRMLQGDQIILDSFRVIETNGCFYPAYSDMSTRLGSLGMTNESEILFLDDPDVHWIFSEGSSVLAGTIRRAMTAEVTRNTVVTAIALKRYQLQHNNYPDSLSQLVPQFLAAVPRDPVDGNPLRYHPNPDGTYLLYSIGPNLKDDGGSPLLDTGSTSQSYYWLDTHALDWVWPQPATPAEIQYFYDHPPK